MPIGVVVGGVVVVIIGVDGVAERPKEIPRATAVNTIIIANANDTQAILFAENFSKIDSSPGWVYP